MSFLLSTMAFTDGLYLSTFAVCTDSEQSSLNSSTPRRPR